MPKDKDNVILKKGYKQTEIGVIPEDWEVKRFGEIINYVKGFAFKPKDYKPDGIRIIRVSDTTYDSIKKENAIYINENRANEFRNWKLHEYDLIISTVGSKPPMYDSMVGKVILITREFAGSLLNQNAVLIRVKEKTKFIQELLLNNFKTKRYVHYIENVFRGNANQASITLEELFKYKIPLPKDKSEQTAIATVLSDTDALIESLEKLIAKKKAIKQGTMQQLLTGKKRLPGFSGEWEVRKLGEVAEIKTGKKNNDDKVEEGAYPFFVRSQQVEKINSYSFDGEAILVPGEGNIGNIYHYINGRFDYHQRVYKISNFSEQYSGMFIYLSMSQNFNVHAMKNSVKATVDSLRLPAFQEFEILFPPTIEEQTAIATILSDMDAEIESLEKKKDKYVSLKQGMMQQLLTGKIRINY